MREFIAQFLNKNEYTDVYQFGVFNGDSSRLAKNTDLSVSYYVSLEPSFLMFKGYTW